MSAFGLPESEVAELVRAVAPAPASEEGGRDSLLERFSRAAWSGIVEPGDGEAGRLVESSGAVPALTLLLEKRPGLVSDDALARWLPRLDSRGVVRSLRQAARFGARLLVPGDDEWPVGLDDLGVHAPLALWVRGEAGSLAPASRSIAIVGARAATGYGEHVTIEATSGLIDRGFAIVSGAAYGIDGAAHRAALASGGSTIAFLAGGVDRFYPAGHEALLNRIVEAGCVVSEVPCGTAPTKWRFLQRNRLIAAASRATIVVEAGRRSGSLNTAGHAAALGRPLGAVPGPVTSAASAGCHRMIRDYGAICVTDADEMAELVLGSAPAPSDPDPPGERRAEQVRVLDALGPRSARPLERIAALSGLAVDRVRAELALLELEGAVVERATGWVRRA